MVTRVKVLLVVWSIAFPPAGAGAADKGDELAAAVAKIDGQVFTSKQRQKHSGAFNRRMSAARRKANRRDREEWAAITSRKQWERFRGERLQRLRQSMKQSNERRSVPVNRVTGTLQGDRFVIERIAFEGRPSIWVTANLYRPTVPRKSMPVILIAHSHHRWKTQGELQDMGMTWARAGCLVLAIDQFGYGERRLHPFRKPDDFKGNYRWSRQDYYHRHDNASFLSLLGDSLMSWFVEDLRRGLDVVLARPGADQDRVIVLGGVAGGGDPAAVMAALDERVDACVPFNFGGPQPETRYPLPKNAAETFNYVGGSYWDTTRGLANSVRDGFHQWFVVASIAPRRLIHAHEFSWDRARDPVWKRYEKIYGQFYDVKDRLGFAHGKGLLRGPSAEASHCTTIGRFHRQLIHPLLKRWFRIEATEFRQRVSEQELLVADSALPDALASFQAYVTQRAKLANARRRDQPTAEWKSALKIRLGNIDAAAWSIVAERKDMHPLLGEIRHVDLEVGNECHLPIVVIRPTKKAAKSHVIVCLSRSGKATFLKQRSQDIARLLEAGATICLTDVQGAGELSGGQSRGRTSSGTDRSANWRMFGETVIGTQVSDLRTVLAFVRKQVGSQSQITIWADSFVAPYAEKLPSAVPHGAGQWARFAEPGPGLVALVVALLDDVRGVYVHRAVLTCRAGLVQGQFRLPADAIIPGLIDLGDTEELVRRQTVPVWLAGTVDGGNLLLSSAQAKSKLAPAPSKLMIKERHDSRHLLELIRE